MRVKDWAPVVAVVLALACLATGCGASALERHTQAAGALHALADGSAGIIETSARFAGEQALSDCDGTEEECSDEVRAAVEAFQPAAHAQRMFAASVEAYIEALIIVADDDQPVFRDALIMLSAAVEVYGELADTLEMLGVQLPAIHDVIFRLLN